MKHAARRAALALALLAIASCAAPPFTVTASATGTDVGPASTDGRHHRCGLVTVNGVTDHLAAYRKRCGHGHALNVNDMSYWISPRDTHREIKHPTEIQLYRFDCLTMGNRKCGPAWHRLSSAWIDAMTETANGNHPWERCRIKIGDTTFVDCPDWSIWTS